jgi:hypothetical protein
MDMECSKQISLEAHKHTSDSSAILLEDTTIHPFALKSISYGLWAVCKVNVIVYSVAQANQNRSSHVPEEDHPDK